MKIEEGKYYKARNGQVYGPMTKQNNGGFLVIGSRIEMADPFDWFDDGHYTHFTEESPLDLILEVSSTKSPIQTRTVKELVPGVYGRVYVDECHIDEKEFFVRIIPNSEVGKEPDITARGAYINAQELRDAAQTFIELADYLEEKE